VTASDFAAVPQPVWLGFAAVVGLVFGSFVTAVSYRLPRGLNFVNARSQCPACATVLATRDLLPVLSWALNAGRCRVCSAPVSARYPLIEVLMAGVFVSAVWHTQDAALLTVLLAMAVVMMTLSVIDLETRRLPLPLLAVLAVLALAWRWLGPGDVAQGALLAAAIAGGGLGLAAATRGLLGRPLLGAGDAYALGAAALALPTAHFGVFLGLAGAFGLALGLTWRAVKKEPVFPFAPALFAALWLSVLFGEQMAGFAAEQAVSW